MVTIPIYLPGTHKASKLENLYNHGIVNSPISTRAGHKSLFIHQEIILSSEYICLIFACKIICVIIHMLSNVTQYLR